MPAKATVFYTLAGALERGLGFVFTPVYTRILTPEQFGIYPLYISWLGIATVLLTLELQGGVIYRGLSRFRGREGEFVSSSLGLLMASAAVWGVVLLLFGKAVGKVMGVDGHILTFLFLGAIINGIEGLYFAKSRYEYKYKATSFISVINAFLTPIISLAIIKYSSFKSEGRIIAPIAVGLVITLLLSIRIIRDSTRIFSLDIWSYLLRSSLPLLPHFLASSVIIQSGKLAISRYFGEDALARYSLVFSLGFLFTVMTVGINSGLSPWINRKLAKESHTDIARVCEKLFSLFGVLSLMAVTFVPEGLSLLAPPEYRDALPAVYPIAVSVIISFLTSVFYTVSVYYEKGHLVTVCTVITAVITLLLHAYFTPKFGYISAAVINCVSSLTNALLYAAIIRGVLKKRIFNPLALATTILFSSAGAYLVYFLRYSPSARVLYFSALLLIAIPKILSCYRLIKEKEYS